MFVTNVNVLPKGVVIEVICAHGGYTYTINDGEPHWSKFDGEKGGGGYKSYTALSKTRDSKLITKLNKEWKSVKFYG